MLIRYVLNTHPLWNTPEEFTQALSLLPPSTHAKIQKYHFPADRKLSLGSQLLQRLLICRLSPSRLPLSSITSILIDPASSRPYFSPGPNDDIPLKDYNVSHHRPRRDPSQKCLVILAASDSGRVGVDVVPTHHDSSDAQGFLESFKDVGVFTPYELGVIHKEDTPARRVRMQYLHWALKEAYVKAVGTGLVTDLLKIEFRGVMLFDLMGDQSKRVFDGIKVWVGGVQRDEWWFEVTAWEGNGGESFYFAVAVERNGDVNAEGKKQEEEGEWEALDYRKDILIPWGGLQE